MQNFDELIGIEVQEATRRLHAMGIDNIETILNSKHNDKCDTMIVSAVKFFDGKVTLVCGEFYIDIKPQGDMNVF